ncbi:MAG: queuosine precursor transporter [Candidatus Gracilibacteria bacterium]
MGSERKRQLLLGIFVMSLVLANTLGAKVTQFDIPNWLAWPFNLIFSPMIFLFNYILTWTGNAPLSYAFFNTISVSVGILTVPLMFLVIDIVHEVWGKKSTKQLINTGVIAMVIMILITWLSVKVPVGRFAGVAPDQLDTYNTAYNGFFSVSIRMAIASILAFYLSQLSDILIFHFWRKQTKGKFYWLRKNVSTFISEMLDSTIFMFVAFYDPTNFPASLVIKLILPYYIFKVLFSILDTPFAYLGIWWARRGEKGEELALKVE